MLSYKTIVIAMLLGGLTACASDHDILDQKLAGKSATERHEILDRECSAEASRGLKGDQVTAAHIRRFVKICEEMVEEPINTD